MTSKKRILTGDRTTGKLHLGHFVGSHRHRLALQDEYECFFLLADLHMLTTKPSKEDIEGSTDSARAIVMDHLAIGIDPSKVTFCLQSAIHLLVAIADQQPGDGGTSTAVAYNQVYGQRRRL